MHESLAIGVDIGGSHITAAVVNLATQHIIRPTLKRAVVNASAGADEIISAWYNVLSETAAGINPKSVRIGIAIPGPFDYEQGISYMQGQNKFDNLYGLSIRNLLAEQLAIAPDVISFLNDAACFLKGEVFGGAAKGGKKVLGLTLGTGFGSAICHDDRVVDANLWCDSYQDGIAEDLFSTRWFIKRFRELTGKDVNNVKNILATGCTDQSAEQVFNEFGRNLGEYLVLLQSRFQFDTVVVGGNIAKSFSLFAKPLQQAFGRHNQQIVLKQTVLNENAALVGAASIWKADHTTLQDISYQEVGAYHRMSHSDN